MSPDNRSRARAIARDIKAAKTDHQGPVQLSASDATA
jgi:hypothetical protein